ncbi:MAG: adenine phosphoribosyltransferase [archaeon]
MKEATLDLRHKIRTIPNWPKQGIMFKDITTLLQDGPAFQELIRQLVARYKPLHVGVIAGIESRGFITGAAIANALGVGFIPLRKKGKLPGETIREEYDLEYGKDVLEIHKDAFLPGTQVLLVDDLLATGGTALAACKLIERLGGKILECSFIVDLPDLGGKKKLESAGYSVFSLVTYAGG